MRRGWKFLLGLVALLVIVCFGSWWTTPVQLWWLQRKVDHYIPPLMNNPGGWDPFYAEMVVSDFLEPQVSRLIARDFVRWYARRLPSNTSPDKLQRLRERFDREISIPHPFHWFFDERSFAPLEENNEVLLIRLLPPDQHAVLVRLCREELGTEGEVIEVGTTWLVPIDLISR